MNSSFMQILRKNNIDLSTNMAVFLRGCKPIFFIRIAGHTEVFSGFLICIDLKKKKTVKTREPFRPFTATSQEGSRQLFVLFQKQRI